MERYDGKTKRDDYIKYGLIGLGIAAVIVGLCLVSHFVRKATRKEPDYTVVIASEEAFNEAMVVQLEQQFSALVGDRNGDGEAIAKVEALRLTDYAQAKLDAALARETYNEELALGISASLEEQFAGISVDDNDFSRLLLHMTEGDCYLYLLSDQARGSFRGAATTYCEQGYFIELPQEMQDSTEPCRAALTNAPFLVDLGLEDIPFYGCVLDGTDSGEMDFAVELLRKLPESRASIY